MIGYLSGLIIDMDAERQSLLILAQNVGYRVKVTTDLLSRVKNDQKIQLFIHTAVREDDISLYGFATKEELAFFNQLIGVSGIGPKIAMDVLSSPIAVTQNAIVSGDADLLTKIKGIGKKTAERIILELKGKVTPVRMEGGQVSARYDEEAILALQGLGYEKMHVVKVLTSMPDEIHETEEIVKYFLRQAS
ncbi:MAG: Holliday junction branch migration protein RuvA [Candidatus Peregrinibacteria bacterium]